MAHMNLQPKGVCIKTCFYRQGPFMHCIATLVDCGNVEVFKASVDMRPIEAAIVKRHKQMHGGVVVGGFFSSLKKAVKSCGMAKLVSSVTAQVKSVASHIPVVGPLASSAVSLATSPASMVAHLAAGGRIDHVLLDTLKSNLKDIKGIAPYAQTVLSMVPGLGTGLSSAIGAATALASGQNITDAVMSGVRSALPGGAVSQAAFSVAEAVAAGKPINQAALSALPISAAQKQALVRGISMSKDLAQGKCVDLAALDAATKGLPPNVLKAAQVATALTTARARQAMAGTAGTAVVIPPIGTMALAAFATTKAAVDCIEEANKVKARVEHIIAHGTPAEKALAAKNADRIQALMKQKAGVQTTLANLATKAKHGDKEALAAQKVFGIVLKNHQALKSRVRTPNATKGIPAMMITPTGKVVPGHYVQQAANKKLGQAVLFDGKKVLRGRYAAA